jgi:hypothetical protein
MIQADQPANPENRAKPPEKSTENGQYGDERHSPHARWFRFPMAHSRQRWRPRADGMSDERRNSFRFPVPEGREKIELKIGRTLVRGRLVDMSAGGFAVEVPADAHLQIGTQIEMRTCDGTHLVEVARAHREGDVRCLGLVRVEDIPLPEPVRNKGGRMFRDGNPLFLLPALVGFAVCAVTIWATCLGPEWTSTTVFQPVYDSLARAFNFDEGRKLRARFGAPLSHEDQPIESQPAEQAQPTEPEEIGQSWTAWSDYMELTPEQHEALRTLLDDKFETMKPSQLDELPAEGLQQIDDVLTDDQKQRLKEFLAAGKSQ